MTTAPDIVERLRSAGRGLPHAGETMGLCAEAADLITRLRADRAVEAWKADAAAEFLARQAAEERARELDGVLRECRSVVLAMLTEPKTIRSTTVHNAWAEAVAAEAKARDALRKAGGGDG